MKKSEPCVREEALQILRESMGNCGLSQRALARRMGLASHAMLSRVLAGAREPTPAFLLTLCTSLRIEGRGLQKVLAGLAPDLGPLHSAPVRAPEITTSNTKRRTANTRFFFDVRAPLVFETLKILKTASAADIASAFHGPLVVSLQEAEGALRHLNDCGYVEKNAAGEWRVIDDARDTVIPSGAPAAVAAENVRVSLKTALASIPHDGKRIIRSTLASVATPASGSAVDALRSLIVALHDDVLSQQGESDDAVVQVVVSVVELARVARAPRAAPTARTLPGGEGETRRPQRPSGA